MFHDFNQLYPCVRHVILVRHREVNYNNEDIYGYVTGNDYNAVILSCDEIENELFHHELGEKHDEVIKDIKRYLHKKASEIVLVGETADYFVNDGLLEKLSSLFETPKKEEVDVWRVNQRK